MDEGRRASSVERHHICTNVRTRLYYLGMAGIFSVTLFIEVVALGSFGIQFSRTRDFWVNNVNGDSKVCVLYGSVSYTLNPTLTNNASCGFALWALVSIVIVLVTWTVYYGVLAVLGCPNVRKAEKLQQLMKISLYFVIAWAGTSLARILDLIMACAMAVVSLILSSILTDGFYKTCASFNRGIYNLPCNKRHFVAVGNSDTLSFFGNLEAAKDASWVVMIIFTLLSCWNVVLLFLHCCFKHAIDERTKLTKDKPEPRDFPQHSEEDTTEQTGGSIEEKKEDQEEHTSDYWSTIPLFFCCCFNSDTEEMSKLMVKSHKLEPLEGDTPKLKRQKAIRKKKHDLSKDFPDSPDESAELVGESDEEKVSESKDFPDFP